MARQKQTARKKPEVVPPRQALASKAARKSAPSVGGYSHGLNFDNFLADDGDSPKRKYNDGSSSENDADDIDLRSAKRVRLSPPSSPPSDKSSQEVIKNLKAQIEELHDFIESSGLMLQAPPNIRKHLERRKGAAAVYAAAVRKAIRDAYSPLAEECYDAKKSGVTSDDISAAMEPFIKSVEKLSFYPGPESLDLAIELLLDLGGHSYGELDTPHGCCFGDRPSDVPADHLLCQLAKEKHDKDPEWDYSSMLDDLKAARKNLKDYGIDTYFARAVKMMQRWSAPTPQQ